MRALPLNEPFMGRRKTQDEMEHAEVRYRTFLERRDERNAEARALREERDLLNGRSAELRGEARALRERRATLLRAVREHKGRRNDLQARAKDLIRAKGEMRGRLRGSPEEALARQEDRIERLERRQETSATSLDDEAALLEEIRRAREDLQDLKGTLTKHRKLLHEVGEMDATIDGLFRQAEAEHTAVVELSQEVLGVKGDLDEKEEALSLVQAEADRMHRAFLAVKERADRYHTRAAEMREKILSIRRARREEDREARAAMKNQREAARQALEDEEAVEEVVEEALAILRDKGKLEL